MPMQFAQMDQPVSVCHQWSMTGTRSFSPRPVEGVGVGALTGEEEGPEGGEVVAGDVLPGRVLALDRAERGRSGEHHPHVVLGDDPPEGAGIGGPHRLALEHDGRVAGEEGAA